MALPVITGDSPTMRQAFKHGEQIYLCERALGEALAEAILELKRNQKLRETIAQNGYQIFIEKFDLKQNGELFLSHLDKLHSRKVR